MGFHVAERAREMGIRVALGAARGRVFAPAMARGLRLVLAGVAIGLAGAAAAAKLVWSQLFCVGPLYCRWARWPRSCCSWPSRPRFAPALRAVREDPVTAMRAE